MAKTNENAIAIFVADDRNDIGWEIEVTSDREFPSWVTARLVHNGWATSIEMPRVIWDALEAKVKALP